MSEPSLRGVGPFESGISAELRARRSEWLAKACVAAPEGRRLLSHLGRIADPDAREAALAEFETFGSVPRKYILRRYLELQRK